MSTPTFFSTALKLCFEIVPLLKKSTKPNIKKVVYLSVRVFSTVVLIVDTVNKQTNITNRTEIC